MQRASLIVGNGIMHATPACDVCPYRFQAMSAPGDDGLQLAATKALLPNVDGIRTFFELSRDMEQVCYSVRWSVLVSCIIGIVFIVQTLVSYGHSCAKKRYWH